MTSLRITLTAIFIILVVLIGSAQSKIALTVQVDQPGAKINPAMWGLFFEDINFGADGGLYAELVKNRSFEFPEPMMGWHELRRAGAEGTISVRDKSPLKAGTAYGEPGNAHYLRIDVTSPGQGFGVTNGGFRGMGLRKSETYWFSVYARSLSDEMAFTVEIIAKDGRKLGEGRFTDMKGDWRRCLLSMNALDTDNKATLNFLVTCPGTLEVDMVSLFPENSAVSDPSGKPIPGLRRDLVKMLKDMEPGFLRFPGGCIVEGYDLSLRYQWKNTVGDISQRKLIKNRWNTEFQRRLTPDYYQSFGLGFYEYFVLSEQLGAEPMPIINCGMACQFNSGELVPVEELGPYIQDALDLIEFANGPVDSPWGKVRADMGHPQPFEMKMLGVGNEQWGPQYVERYIPFARAIKDKYPDIELIAATGSDARFFPNGEAEIKFLWEQWRKLKPEWVDEHFYRDPNWFLDNTAHYDEYGRDDPPVLVGEYAAHSRRREAGRRKNDWESALAEAAMMTGFERNADLVHMTSYAPLMAHADAWQWSPNLIWFDNLRVVGTANYYVQRAFSTNRGDVVLPVQVTGAPTTRHQQPRFYATAALDRQAGDVILKLVNVTPDAQATTIELADAAHVGRTARVTILASDRLDDENSLAEPRKVYPRETALPVDGPSFSCDIVPYSLTIMRIPVE